MNPATQAHYSITQSAPGGEHRAHPWFTRNQQNSSSEMRDLISAAESAELPMGESVRGVLSTLSAWVMGLPSSVVRVRNAGRLNHALVL
jgi:hypothetical protein